MRGLHTDWLLARWMHSLTPTPHPPPPTCAEAVCQGPSVAPIYRSLWPPLHQGGGQGGWIWDRQGGEGEGGGGVMWWPLSSK